MSGALPMPARVPVGSVADVHGRLALQRVPILYVASPLATGRVVPKVAVLHGCAPGC